MASTALEQLEQSKQRVERANSRRQRIQVQLEAARQQYTEAVKEAEAAYGTADLNQLRTLLAQQEADNEKAILEFVRAVNEFEGFIARIEAALADPEAMTALLESMPAPAPAAAPSPAPKAAQVRFNDDDI